MKKHRWLALLIVGLVLVVATAVSVAVPLICTACNPPESVAIIGGADGDISDPASGVGAVAESRVAVPCGRCTGCRCSDYKEIQKECIKHNMRHRRLLML